ncbi:putative NAD-specific glutamate dehydrogenase [Celeribacter indicus]|uniref:Putative NAD-specific glutamate dehydrogenase n=1 Tax=Celeribacter indicus TaxID=1208324 RepID=A0A0B5DMY6_9RHOB|nr:putative NAD-specific glutamate dehydrogenase [Celeribacter indicus]
MLFHRLLGRMDEALRLVLRLDETLAFLVRFGVLLGVLHHAFDVVVRQTAGGLDRDLLLLAGALVLRTHLDDAVGVDVKGDLDLRHAARCRRDAFEVELAEQLVVGGHLALTLEDAQRHGGLIVLGRREDLRLLRRDRGVAVDEAGEHAAERLDAERERGHVEQQDILHVTLQNARLNGGAHGHDFVRVHALVRLLAEELGHFFNDLRHTGHPADEHDLVDVGGGQASILERRLARIHGALDQVGHEAFELRTGQLDHEVKRRARGRVHRDERLVDFRLRGGGQFDLRLFGGFLQALQRHLVLGQVDAMLLFELLGEVVHDAHVEVFTTEEGVAVGGLHFEDAIAELEDGHVEGAAAEVVDRDGLRVGFVEAIGQRGGRRFVDDAQDFEAGDLAGVLRRLTLGIVEIGGNRDDGLRHFFTEVGLGGFLHLAEDEGRDLRGRIFLSAHFHPGVAIAAIHDGIGHQLLVLFHLGIADPAADQAFHGENGVVGVGDCLTFGRLADEALAVGEPHDGGRRARSLGVLDHTWLRTVHDGDTGVRGPEVDTNDFGHAQNPLLGDVVTRGPYRRPPSIPVILTGLVWADRCSRRI